MLGLAQEVMYGTYGSGAAPPHPIRMYDLVNGGGQNFFPEVNQNCTPNPATRSYLTITGVSIAGGPQNQTYYYNASIGAASNLSAGDVLYTDSGLSTYLATNVDSEQPAYEQATSSASTSMCSTSYDVTYLYVGYFGVIVETSCVNL
jgi:hypothetical protein